MPSQELTPESLEHELDASRLGMWVFLSTEVLFFGALFCAFAVYRFTHYEAFGLAARKLDLMLGSLNTGVLLTSSLTMAAAVHSAQGRRFRGAALWLAATAVLGAAFLAVKGLEWSREIREGLWPGPGFAWEGAGAHGARLYFSLYFCMTGLHAFHMIVGLAAVALIGAWCALGRIAERDAAIVECLGLYWHFVDIVWIWLFPLLYLLGRSSR